MARAAISLPTPVSPRIKTVGAAPRSVPSNAATRSICSLRTRIGAHSPTPSEDLDAVHPGQSHVDDGDVGARTLRAQEPVLAGEGDHGAEPMVLQVCRDRVGEDPLVVDDQDVPEDGHAGRLVENVTWKRAPPSGALPALMAPSLASMNFLARARPSPVPLGLVGK